MNKDILNVWNYLHLSDVGRLELLVALTPMLSGYALGIFPMGLLMWIALIAVTLLKHPRLKVASIQPFTLFVVYWVLHTMVMMFIDDVNLNGFASRLISFAAVFVLVPYVDLRKLRGAMNWVMLIAIVGLLYQWADILRGNLVHPLELPGLSMSEERLETLSLRPSSFFMEPAAYVAFAVVPLFLALKERKWMWAAVLILSMFLTTSTTGIVLSFLMLAMTVVVGGRRKFKHLLIVVLLGGGMFYALTHFEAFSVGVEKYENTELDNNARTSRGPQVVSTMHPGEFIFGAPYGSVNHYCRDRQMQDIADAEGGSETYMSTFWQFLLLYGVVGVLLYINIYVQLLRRNFDTLPLVTCAFVTLFSASWAIGVVFIYLVIFLYVFVRDSRQRT